MPAAGAFAMALSTSAMAQAAAAAETAEAAASAPPAEDSPVMAVANSTWERVSSSEAWHGPGFWRVLVSPFTYHWRYSPEHRDVYAVGMERQYEDRWLLGGALFTNSFGQPSAYAYLGQRYDGLLERQSLFFQWSAGLMYGYVGRYKSKVPMNVDGFSPGALIGLGWQFDRNVSMTFHLLGDAGVMFQLAYDLR